MRMLFIIVSLFFLSGCETLATAVDKKELSFSIYDTPNVHHGFGYYNEQKYIGYNVTGTFGKETRKNTKFW